MDKDTYSEILDFWFSDTSKALWFNSTAEFDELIRTKFLHLWQRACQNQLSDWNQSPLSALSLVIVLDQFPLNMFRREAKSFASEKQAISVTRNALSNEYDKQLNNIQLPFLYMPLMHSENLADQNDSVRLIEKAGLENNLRFAEHHRDIIKTFGRFPHRNIILGRISTAAEIEYLNSPQAFKG